MGEKIKHLEMIQDTIKRMSSNSFFIKGWTVTLVSALIALLIRESKMTYLYIIILPLITFWSLDGYFLREEKLYRCLYDDICGNKAEDINFSMDTSIYGDRVNNWISVCFTNTLVMFYGGIILTVIVIDFLIM